MKKTLRYDVQKLDGYEVTPQGFLRIPVYAARTGIQNYRRLNDKGESEILREYRPADEVFSERTMGSLRSCPLTNNHPSKMVDVENARDLMCGFTADFAEKIDNKYLKTYVVVYDKDMIELIRAGKREVSMGYDVELDFTPGEFEGQKYDAIQRNIVHNHIALVDRGRAGREVRLRLDSGSAVLVTDDNTPEEDQMAKMKIGEKEFDVAQEVADAFGAYCKEMESKASKGDSADAEIAKANEKVTALETEKKALATEKDGLQAKVDGLTADLEKAKNASPKADHAEIEKAVKERRRLDKVAERVMGAEEFKKSDSMSALELKKAVIMAECKDADLKDKSEDYVTARFDHIAEGVEKSAGANGDAGRQISQNRKDAGKEETVDSEKARQKAIDDSKNLWKQPIGKAASK